jgi:anhydro-N-acetylmuramic acid kinase
MVYRVIGLMSGSSLDGLDIAYVEFHENAGKWNYKILQADCCSYSTEWVNRLKNATALSALDYQLLHTEYGHYIGQQVNKFMEEIASHGHTTFHIPAQKMTAQLGDGAAIAAETQLPVVTDLRSLDVAFGGQGAPIVPVGEKLLWSEYDYFLNIGGIANISYHHLHGYTAFDVCPANRVLNMLANKAGKEYDDSGQIATGGKIDTDLLAKLNALDYYKRPYPKSLANDFGTGVVYPVIQDMGYGLGVTGYEIRDALRTYTEHITVQIKNAINVLNNLPALKLRQASQQPANAEASVDEPVTSNQQPATKDQQLLLTGGGALNSFLVQRLKEQLKESNIEVVVPDAKLVNYKEALIMALIGVLRWRQEYNVLSSVTGATRDSIGGALWTGQEA